MAISNAVWERETGIVEDQIVVEPYNFSVIVEPPNEGQVGTHIDRFLLFRGCPLLGSFCQKPFILNFYDINTTAVWIQSSLC